MISDLSTGVVRVPGLIELTNSEGVKSSVDGVKGSTHEQLNYGELSLDGVKVASMNS